MTTADVRAADRIRAAGLRATAQRVAVLEALTDLDHPGVDAVVSAVRAREGAVSVQAVYDVLRALTAAGLVGRIEPAGSPARFESRAGDNHHHVVCRQCALAVDVDCVVGSAPCLEPSRTHGFVVDRAEVTFWGICPGCRTTDGSVPRTTLEEHV